MKCEWNELVECGVSLPFMVIMNRDSYSWTDKNEKRNSYSLTEGVISRVPTDNFLYRDFTSTI